MPLSELLKLQKRPGYNAGFGDGGTSSTKQIGLEDHVHSENLLMDRNGKSILSKNMCDLLLVWNVFLQATIWWKHNYMKDKFHSFQGLLQEFKAKSKVIFRRLIFLGALLLETLQINLERISLDIWWLQTMNLVVFLRGQCT